MKRYDIKRTPIAPPRLLMVESGDGDYVLYSEAQARIEALEWLVEVQDFGWTCDLGDCDLTDAAHDEWTLIYRTARAAVEGA